MQPQYPEYLSRYGEDPSTYGRAHPSETRPGAISGTLYLLEGLAVDPDDGTSYITYVVGCDHSPLGEDHHLLDGVLFAASGEFMGLIADGAIGHGDDGTNPEVG